MARVRLTNKTPCATYRAPGRFESTFVRSRLMDAVADKLGLDRIEVRRRNLITAAEMPYMQKYNEPGIEELDIDSGDYALLLDKALAAFGWDKLQQDMQAPPRRRRAGRRRARVLSGRERARPERQRQGHGRYRPARSS